MIEVNRIVTCLKQSPFILESLLKKIPRDLIKNKRRMLKWSIHENACHVAVGEKYGFHKRFKSFLNEDNPIFTPLSGDNFPEDFYLMMSLDKAMLEFIDLRKESINLINSKYNTSEFWNKTAQHPEYITYTPLIMTRHLLMHDHIHFHRIEDLWLTNDEFLLS